LPTDDVEVYQNHVQQFIDEYKPVGPRESELVQALADHSWRLDRIAVLEHALYAHGFEEFSQQFANRGDMQAGFTQMHTFLVYEKQFRNLQTQEMRIRRNREKDTAELRSIQSARQQQQRVEAKQRAAQAAQTTPQTAHLGFEFSEAPLDEDEVEMIDIDDIPAALAGLDTDSIPASLASFLRSRTESTNPISAAVTPIP
jgi:ATPase subunit of ABC transporter with duplicated ATPase domains